MTYVLVTDETAKRLTGNPTLTRLDGEERCTFGSIRDSGLERLAEFGVYVVDTTPPDGQRWTGQFDGTVTPPVAVFEEMSAPLTPVEILASLPSVSHAQMIAALIAAEIITSAEGRAWISGTLPAKVDALIASLPEGQQDIAYLRAVRPFEVVPTDPLIAALALMEDLGVVDLIDIFTSAAAL